MCGVGGWVGVAVCVGVYGAGLCAWVGVADGLARVRMGWVVGRCAGVWCELGGSWTGLVVVWCIATGVWNGGCTGVSGWR